MKRADIFIATAPRVAVYCIVKDCPYVDVVDPEEEGLARMAARIHVNIVHKSLLMSSEPATIES